MSNMNNGQKLSVEPSSHSIRGIKTEEIRMKAELGRSIIADLGGEFRTKNYGKFVAIGLRSKQVIVIADTLGQLGKELQSREITESCYIARIGYDVVANIQ